MLLRIFFATVFFHFVHSLNVSIYYETLCDDSVRFLLNEFYPSYLTNSDHLNVDLIPFGKASANNYTGNWEFICQHGYRECYGNKVHSCIINLYPVEVSTNFVICSMISRDASSKINLRQCSLENNITWSVIQNCLDTGKGDELLAINGIRTALVQPRIKFIPMIIFDNIYSESLERLALSNFNQIVDFLIDKNECQNCRGAGSHQDTALLLKLSILLVGWLIR